MRISESSHLQSGNSYQFSAITPVNGLGGSHLDFEKHPDEENRGLGSRFWGLIAVQPDFQVVSLTAMISGERRPC